MLDPLAFYKCLSEDTRLKSLLLITLKGELCVCDLTRALELSQPKVSRHLSELRKCELLKDERRGKWVYYKLNESLPTWAISVLQQTAEDNPKYIERNLKLLDPTTTASCC
jgi:ArsR family transcriptional regulator